ncbi:ubiquitin-related modifier 1 homolog 1 [Phtheirospermum japonicum]|uniref:Ubiquitin-related modifier 1 homolog 1 n=1 Tax=Phtheirospermum japonicum TaxID=374723 RepID=A0A830C169_9LAMI|nr:ubiquitin-related modifier 1 homolog 1 [Phtheirospermum japonicum]
MAIAEVEQGRRHSMPYPGCSRVARGRPGVLVLVNDCDWGQLDTILKEKDSALHHRNRPHPALHASRSHQRLPFNKNDAQYSSSYHAHLIGVAKYSSSYSVLRSIHLQKNLRRNPLITIRHPSAFTDGYNRHQHMLTDSAHQQFQNFANGFDPSASSEFCCRVLPVTLLRILLTTNEPPTRLRSRRPNDPIPLFGIRKVQGFIEERQSSGDGGSVIELSITTLLNPNRSSLL